MWFGIRARLDPYIKTIEGLFHKDTWQEIEECDVLFTRHYYELNYEFKGKAYASLIDSMHDICRQKGIVACTIDKPFSKNIGQKAYYPSVSFNRSYAIFTIIGKFISIISKKFGRDWLISRKVQLWLDVLQKAKPKVIIGLQPDECLCQACFIQNISVFDLQHGIISDQHSWYGSEFKKDSRKEELPSGFLCWDDQSVATIKKWADNKGIRSLKIGNPWHMRFIKSVPDDILVSKAYKKAEIIHDTRPSILVSLQWGMSTHNPESTSNGVMADALEAAILETIEDYNWILRLHQVQMQGIEKEYVMQYLTSTFGKKIAEYWLSSSKIPLPVILRNIELHITHSSSVVIEAAWLGVRSGILSQKIKDNQMINSYFSYERSIGIAELVPDDPNQIKKWIAATLQKGSGKSTANIIGDEIDIFFEEIKNI